MRKDTLERLLVGALGALLVFFIGWRRHVDAAAWLSAILLVRSFRLSRRMLDTLPVIVLAVAARFASLLGGWDMPWYLALAFGFLVELPLIAALLADRAYSRADGPAAHRLLAFPVLYTLGDFLLGLSPVGTTMSPAAGQYDRLALVQLLSVTGLWGITFLMGLAATAANDARERGFDLRACGRKAAWLAALALAVAIHGYARPLMSGDDRGTVRVAGVTRAHPRDYWSITDAGTPREAKALYADEMAATVDALFADSARAADAGARIIVWSEGNAALFEDQVDGFLARAGAFAKAHGVYLAPAVVSLRYGMHKNDNLVYLIDPAGAVLFRYEKTKSWYPTESDGVVPHADTPWGTVSAIICFDLDFPALVRQAYRSGVDLLLVPGYDTRAISPYHTRAGLLRGVEYGMSVFRQANESTSAAADRAGTVLARQDFFAVEDRVMVADLPMGGCRTVYGELGDWFVLLAFAAAFAELVRLAVRASRGRRGTAGAPRTEAVSRRS